MADTLWQKTKRAFKFQDATPTYQVTEQPRFISVHSQDIGSSGVKNYSGYAEEEYFNKLVGRPAADLYDQMRRSDPNVKMVLSATKQPIKAASWTIEPSDDTPEAQATAEKIEYMLFEGMDKSWAETLHEILSFIDFGHAPFEITHKQILAHPKFGPMTALRKLGWRSPRTIERWNLDKETGNLVSISQYAYGDLQRLVDIPAEFLLTFTMDKEGDAYDGVSMLRPCYGPWLRKNTYLKLMAIGIEKYAVPTPILKVPDEKQNSEQYDKAVQVIKQYLSHQQQFISVPTGWEIDFNSNTFDAEKIRTAIDAENKEMVSAFLANFLSLGSGGGSYALSFDLSDFFLSSIEHIAKLICDVVNRSLIPQLVKLNDGEQDSYPTLKCSGISDKAGKELAEVLKLLADGKIIVPDDNLEDDIRSRYGFSKKSDLGQRSMDPAPTVPVTTPALAPVAAAELKLADPKKQITKDKASIKELMNAYLGRISDNMKKQIMSKYRTLTPSQRLNAIKNVSTIGAGQYKNSLLDTFASVATVALAQARREVPKAKNVKLNETSTKLSEFENLPLDIQRRLKTLSGLLVDTQLADLEKALFFTYQNSVDSTDSEAQLEKDLDDATEKYITGVSIDGAAGNSASQVVNEARNAFFFDDTVSEQIESFTFVNADPVSPICQDLAGTVFSKDDPNADRYWPPLHFNCKSYIIPNLVGADNPDLDKGGLKPSKASLEKFINLAEEPQTFALQSISISKEIAVSGEDAKRIAMEYKADTSRMDETEKAYVFTQKDAGLFVEGSLKTMSPMKGVLLFMGLTLGTQAPAVLPAPTLQP